MTGKMNYAIVSAKKFKRDFKKLLKKYRSLEDDVESLKDELRKNPTMGNPLGMNAYKVRMAIASKGGGKRGGARVITCHVLIDVENSEIYLLTMYDKSEHDTISKDKIIDLKREAGLS